MRENHPAMNFDQKPSAKEIHSLHNSLAILLKAVEGKKTTVDLRNEAYVCGIVEQADGFMNVVMKDCIFTDPRGDKFPFETFFVHARNIRCVHIPPSIPVIPAIKSQLELLNHQFRRRNQPTTRKKTFREKRVATKHMEEKAAVEKILLDRDIKEDPTNPSDE